MIHEIKRPEKLTLELTQQDAEFVDYIKNMITSYGQIPYSVPDQLVIECIKISARFFYRQYWKATERRLYYLTLDNIKTHLQKDKEIGSVIGLTGFSVTLPSYVNVVYEIHETDKTPPPSSQAEIENIQLLQRSSPYGQSILGINNSLYIIERACKMIESQNTQAIFGVSVPFNYNNLSKTLYIKKKLNKAVVLECLSNVDVQMLYQDDLFIKYTIANTKKELRRLIGGHTVQLPGDVTLNVDEICNNIPEDLNYVEDILKNSAGIGDIILMR